MQDRELGLTNGLAYGTRPVHQCILTPCSCQGPSSLSPLRFLRPVAYLCLVVVKPPSLRAKRVPDGDQMPRSPSPSTLMGEIVRYFIPLRFKPHCGSFRLVLSHLWSECAASQKTKVTALPRTLEAAASVPTDQWHRPLTLLFAIVSVRESHVHTENRQERGILREQLNANWVNRHCQRNRAA
jgi:hypothetical protein